MSDSENSVQNLIQYVITIDGPSASGKSSVSREVARKLGWSWVSTGAFYRVLGYLANKYSVSQQDEDALVRVLKESNWEVRPGHIHTDVYLDGNLCSPEEIYSVENGTRASNVSQFQKVRDAVLQAQRNAYKLPGLIAEGRDCGSVIFPQAPLKIFLSASHEARSGRRAKEAGEEIQKVQKALEKRDQQDSNRKAAPLAIPEGAWVVDSSEMSLEEVSQQVYLRAKEIFKIK